MPTSNSTFGFETSGKEVVAAYPSAVKGKIILVTGANPGGIGLTTVTSLAAADPKLLIIAGRSASKLDETEKEIKSVNASAAIRKLHLDLSSQKSCREAAKEILNDSSVPHIDILINSAGVMNIPERTISPEGIEMQFATNHIGHFLFTNLIMPKIQAAAKNQKHPGDTRIVNVSSRAVLYSGVRFSDYNFTKKEADMPKNEHVAQSARDLWDQHEDKPYIPQAAYGQSKSANVLFSLSLTEKLYAKDGILAIGIHPGGINTGLGRYVGQEALNKAFAKFQSTGIKWKDLEQGCSTQVTAAIDPKLTKGDLFMDNCQVADWAPAYATNPEFAEKLWKLSEELVGETFSY